MYKEEFSVEGDVLVVRLSGEFPREMLEREANVFEPLAEACMQHGCIKVLIDARGLEVRMETMELFRAGDDLASLVPRGLRVALVARSDTVDDGFFENVASNRGASVKVFTDPEAARRWVAATRDRPSRAL
jgi:hypothetical protein